MTNSEDCDTDQYINPLAQDTCDGVDNNCNGQVDEGNNLDLYLDLDGDGFGDPDTMFNGCPTSNSVSTFDCNDGDANVQLCEDCSMRDNGPSIGMGYQVDPEQLNDPFDVYCDMNSEGGGWTLVAKQVPAEHSTMTDLDINQHGLGPILHFDLEMTRSSDSHPTSHGDCQHGPQWTNPRQWWFKPACVGIGRI